jgi:integrase/recombinase XerD
MDIELIEAQIIETLPIKRGKQEIIPTQQDDIEEEIKYLSIQELNTLLSVSDNAYRLAWQLCYETASRISEALNIRFSDLNLETNRLKITNLKQRKKNSFRLIKISDRLKSLILQEQLWRNCSKEDYILKNRDRTTYNYAFVRYALQGGIERERAHPHTLRHSRAIHLLDSGANIVLVSNALGHKNIKSTLIYLKYSNHELDSALEKANKRAL